VRHQRNQRKVNGHAGPQDRTERTAGRARVGANGHAPASADRGGIPAQRDQTAADDVSGASIALAASSASAPDAVHDAHAEATPPHPGKTNGHLQTEAEKPPNHEEEVEQIPGGDVPLPLQPGDFVEEIHRNTDLFISWQKLLNSKDEKVRQRAVEKVTEMGYKGAAALADEPPPIIFDLPRPKRD
jgi:hypothetical protein